MPVTATATMSSYRGLAEGFLDRDSWGMLIGGQPCGAVGGEQAQTSSPADGRALAVVPDAQPADVDRAVAAARAAYPIWRATPVTERARVVTAIAAIVRQHATELGILDALNSGNPATAMIGEAGWPQAGWTGARVSRPACAGRPCRRCAATG